MDRPEPRRISRRELLKGAFALAGAGALARAGLPAADAATAAAGWWTMAKGPLPAQLGAPLTYLPVGLSEGRELLGGFAKLLPDELAFEPGALPLRDTELWVIGAEVASLSAAEGKVAIELVPGPAYHFVALPTSCFYPYPIWDEGAKIVAMRLTTGEPYEQVVPATYGVEFPSVVTEFEFLERGSGTSLGTISYLSPDQVVEGASGPPAGG